MKPTSKLFLFFAFALIVIHTACEKEVKIKLADGDTQVVVEGSIETGKAPVVILTKSLGFFDKIDFTTLQNNFIHDAVVTVSNGTQIDTLKEFEVDTIGFGIKFYYYSVDETKPSTIKGEVEKFYRLTVTVNGKTHEAVTKIPNPTLLDSVITEIPPIIPDNNPDVRSIKVFFKDPDSLGNYMRYFTKRNSEPYYPGLNSSYSDEIINGTQFQTVLAAGEDRNSEVSFDSLGFFHPGDTAILKWCAIDKGVYNFWNTFEFSLGTIGNPFTSPIKVKTNISNGALGVWAGYGSTYQTIYIK